MAKSKASKKKEEVEPLSEFQRTELTGRADTDAPKAKKPRAKKERTPPADQAPAEVIAPKKGIQLSIQKAKIFDGNFLSITYSKLSPDGTHSEHPGEMYPERYMHKDLRSKFKALAIHMALAMGYISKDQIKNIKRYAKELVESFTVTGVSIKAGEGVVITGHKKTEFKAVANFNTPFTRFGEDESAAYSFVDDLQEKLDELVEEVILYLEGTKVGENPQGELDFDNAGKGEDTYAEEGL